MQGFLLQPPSITQSIEALYHGETNGQLRVNAGWKTRKLYSSGPSHPLYWMMFERESWFCPVPMLCFFILVDVLFHGGFALKPKQSSRETVAKISMPTNIRNAEMKVLHDNNEFVN